VDVVRHHRRQSQLAGQLVEVVVGRVVEGLAVVDQLGGDVPVPEPVDQPLQLGPRRSRAVRGERAADRAFAAAGEDDDVPGELVDHFFEVVDRAAFLAAGDLGVGDAAAEPVLALLLPGEHQQVRTGRVGLAGLRRGQVERELGAARR
jgi:hypothetical protein